MLESHYLVWLVVFLALAFDYINGFHDTANAIATSCLLYTSRSSVGRAPALQAGGQEFESPRLHHLVFDS